MLTGDPSGSKEEDHCPIYNVEWAPEESSFPKSGEAKYGMKLPFSVEQFFDIFSSYNEAIWPAQVAGYALGILALFFVFFRRSRSGRVVSAVLALFWVWIGVFYHIAYFSAINQAAFIFGVIFVVQGVLFLAFGVIMGKLSFIAEWTPLSIIGGGFIVFAMLVYTLTGIKFGHSLSASPIFAVAPCPTVIFTFGILLWSEKPVPVCLLIIPLLWSVIGTVAAISLQVPQDYGLGIAGVLGTVLILAKNRRLLKPDPLQTIRE